MKKIFTILFACLIVVFLVSFFDKIIFADEPLANILSGRILLQTEKNGKAWYVNPNNLERYFLNRPSDAFNIMRELGIGITNKNISKIQVADTNLAGLDTDKDGLSDKFEEAINTLYNDADTDGDGYNDKEEILNGYNPRGEGKFTIDNNLARSMAGKIYIQVEKNGEAWYINPLDLKRYYLGSPQDAFNIMKKLALGISNTDLLRIDEHIDNKNNIVITPIKSPDNNTENKYINNNFELTYPSSWKIKNYSDAPNSILITDSTKDFYLEKKAVILITYIKKNEDVELKNFNISTKPNANKTIDKIETINNIKTLQQAFFYTKTYEHQIILEKNSKEFLSLTLVTSNNNNNYYENIFEDLYNSVIFK